MRKIIVFFITFFCLFLIYNHFDNKKINYVSIGDSLILGINLKSQYQYGFNDYIKKYLEDNKKLSSFNNYFYNNKINSLTKNIKDNRTILKNNNEYFIKKVLRESDVLVISVGMEELYTNYDKYNMNKNNTYFSKMYLNIENLIKEIKKYAKGTILFIGYFNPTNYYDSKTDEFFCNMDIKLNRLMMDNNISYISLYEKVKGNQYKGNINSPYLNTDGYKKLAETIEFYL